MWNSTDDLLIFNYKKETGKKDEIKNKDRIIAFDLDSTLIVTKSGNKFPKDKNDWKFMPGVVDKIQKLPSDIKVLIITNQSSLKATEKIEDFKFKIENIAINLDVQVKVYVLISQVFRKPSSALFEKYIAQDNLSLMYVGDAAGRKSDFSDSDINFAYNMKMRATQYNNCRISFKTPEDFFYHKKEKVSPKYKFNPTKYLESVDNLDNLNNLDKIVEKIENGGEKKLIIMVGAPASGKSTLAEKLSNIIDVVIISNDTMKTKVMSNYKKQIKNRKLQNHVIVDNTNPSELSRTKFTDLVDNDVIYMLFNNIELAKHMNRVRTNRAIRSGIKPTYIPEIVYNIYKKNYTKPKKYIIYEYPPTFANEAERIDFLEYD